MATRSTTAVSAPVNTSRITLASLPTELIALIAVQTDLKSLLSLSRTSSVIRAAVYNTVVLRELLFTPRLGDNWTDNSWDTSALVQRAGSDVQIWLRYTLAVEQAIGLWRVDYKHPSDASTLSDWIAELTILRHPLCFCVGAHSTAEASWTPELYFRDIVLSTMQHNTMGRQELGPNWQDESEVFKQQSYSISDTLCLTTLLSKLILERQKLHRDVWPHGRDANVPETNLPSPSNLRLSSISRYTPDVDLPVPFSRACGLSSTQSWSAWYLKQCTALSMSSDFLFEGEWKGYYSIGKEMPDPPMRDIHFRPREATSGAWTPRHGEVDGRSFIVAEGCRDAVDSFSLIGWIEIWNRTDEVRFVMEKRYRNGIRWAWNCRLTPFGIVGHWGDCEAHPNAAQHGSLWLWKREWCEADG